MTLFEADTDLRLIGENRYTIDINRNWWVMAGPNGGLVAALMTRAAERSAGDPDRCLRTLTVHYLTPLREGPAEIAVTVERSGRAVTYLSLRMTQGDRAVSTALAAVAARRSTPLEWQELSIPATAPPDQGWVMVSEPGRLPVPIRDRWETRWTVGVPGHPAPEVAGPEEFAVGGWIRPSQPQDLDRALVTAMVDSWIPPLLVHGVSGFNVPTVELTIHIRSDPAGLELAPDDWYFALFRTRTAHEGFLEEEGQIWSAGGILIAQSRQLAVVTEAPEAFAAAGPPMLEFRPVTDLTA